jgi:hypothetical protein
MTVIRSAAVVVVNTRNTRATTITLLLLLFRDDNDADSFAAAVAARYRTENVITRGDRLSRGPTTVVPSVWHPGAAVAPLKRPRTN